MDSPINNKFWLLLFFADLPCFRQVTAKVEQSAGILRDTQKLVHHLNSLIPINMESPISSGRIRPLETDKRVIFWPLFSAPEHPDKHSFLN
jgi:hypothetical protein